MKSKLLTLVLFTAIMFSVTYLANAQEKKEGCCSDKKSSECTTHKSGSESGCTDTKMSSDCKTKTGNSQGTVLDSAKLCPVSGEPVDAEGASVKFTYLGKEYEFCCGGCLKKFKAEPMSYIKTEIKCPVMGEAASKDVSTVVDGVKYYFCCESCIKKFEKEPSKYLNK